MPLKSFSVFLPKQDIIAFGSNHGNFLYLHVTECSKLDM